MNDFHFHSLFLGASLWYPMARAIGTILECSELYYIGKSKAFFLTPFFFFFLNEEKNAVAFDMMWIRINKIYFSFIDISTFGEQNLWNAPLQCGEFDIIIFKVVIIRGLKSFSHKYADQIFFFEFFRLLWYSLKCVNDDQMVVSIGSNILLINHNSFCELPHLNSYIFLSRWFIN